MLVEERIRLIRENMEEMREAAQDNSKSSAGDKHETGRAMTDLEIEKQQGSLQNLLQMQNILKQLDSSIREKVVPGVLIETRQGLFYVAIALGKIQVEDKEVLVISADAPIVKVFGQFPTQKKVIFNGRTYDLIRLG